MKTPVPAFAFALLCATVLRAADSSAFQKQLETDLRQNIERLHTAAAGDRAKNIPVPELYYPYLLSGEINLHAKTGEPTLLKWAKDDLLWIVRSSIGKDGHVTPFFANSFRFLAPFCDAYLYLKSHGQLSTEEASQVAAQITANADARLDRADFGAQNRGMIYGSELLFCAHAVPNAPLVDKWRRQGEALVYDSLNGWDVEDASIYVPFWFNYLLTLEEMRGNLPERMKKVTAHFYFEQEKELEMPDGLLPDWGDGDWTHSWMWDMANMVLAGSHYHDGSYMEAARRLYNANHAYYRDLPAEAVGAMGIALRWLDPATPMGPLVQDTSAEVVDDLVSKKIVFRGPADTYAMFTYRDVGPFGRFTRDYQRAQLNAYEEKPHHGHADENSFAALVQDGTVLLDDGGYRASFARGWRADVFHNRIVARTGFPPEGDIFDYIRADTTFHEVQTEKIHFGTFGSLDYARTRLVDEERGYTGDRITLFAPESGLTIVVDSLVIDRPGSKVFCNTWHPDHVLAKGDNWIMSHPDQIPIRTEYWPNPHTRNLVIEFLGNRDKIADTKVIDRRFNPSSAFYQYLKNYFFQGQRLTFVTVLRPIAVDADPKAVLGDVQLITDEHDDGRTLGLTFTLGGDPVTVGLKLDQTIGLTNLRGRPMFDAATGAVSYGKIKTDADFSFVREHRDGSREFAFQYATALSYQGSLLYEQPVWKGMYQEPGDFAVTDRRDKMPRWHEVAPPK